MKKPCRGRFLKWDGGVDDEGGLVKIACWTRRRLEVLSTRTQATRRKEITRSNLQVGPCRSTVSTVVHVQEQGGERTPQTPSPRIQIGLYFPASTTNDVSLIASSHASMFSPLNGFRFGMRTKVILNTLRLKYWQKRCRKLVNSEYPRAK